MSDQRDDFSNLDAPGRLAAGVARRPQWLVVASLALAVAVSWAMLAAMARRAAETGQGPGHRLAERLPDIPLPDMVERFFALCLTPAAPGAASVELASLAAMWFLMSIAMMLPTAAPMVKTYCEIADTAAAKGEAAAHPLVLVAGYLVVWLLASILFAGLTAILRGAGAMPGLAAPLGGVPAALALGLAGLYQFSALKRACLEKCRQPFAVLFARWSPRPAKIFRLGMEQGAWCLGCCWALMLVMFAVGLMNIFWMALVGLFSLVEKQTGGGLSTWAAGAILLVWSMALLVVSL